METLPAMPQCQPSNAFLLHLWQLEGRGMSIQGNPLGEGRDLPLCEISHFARNLLGRLLENALKWLQSLARTVSGLSIEL